jgi:NAD(P)-dependent dehydrogenase (short-subunit alcohol dehydrogenase family)
MLDSELGEEDQKHYASRTPLRRLGQLEDIANAVIWLSSPMAAYITGISLPVDGGFSLSTGPP